VKHDAAVIVNVWSVPPVTETLPEGEIDPPVPAEARMVKVASPIAKSLNDVMPVACVLVAVRVPVVGADQFGVSYFRTKKLLGFAPPSMSPGTKLNTASAVVKVVPEFVSVQLRLTLLVGIRFDDAICAWSPPVALAGECARAGHARERHVDRRIRHGIADLEGPRHRAAHGHRLLQEAIDVSRGARHGATGGQSVRVGDDPAIRERRRTAHREVAVGEVSAWDRSLSSYDRLTSARPGLTSGGPCCATSVVRR
jgi:hypothetical protein